MDSFSNQLQAGFLATGCDLNAGMVLAVSGGADSMALLAGALELIPRNRLLVGHVNHGLRGAESDSDQQFVAQFCESRQVPFAQCSATVDETSRRAGESVEEAARRIRYDVLMQLALSNQLRFVTTAHHQQDQAETILHHLIRGTGLRGLTGMSSGRPLSDSIDLLRPMLGIRSEEILRYLSERRIEHRTDSTNTDTAFTRNRIRHTLLPMLRQEFNPKVEERLMSLASQAEEAVACLDSLADRLIQRAVLESQRDCCRLSLDVFDSSPVALIRHAMTRLWSQQDWPRQKMTAQHWNDIANCISAGHPVAKDLPNRFRFERTGRMLRIQRRSNAT